MYLPNHFKNEDLPAVHAAIEAAGLATLVTSDANGMQATHAPMIFDASEGAHGALYGHIARANPQWRTPLTTPALAIFLGPDGYITPNWYPSKAEAGKAVPTWNYVAIHATGPLTWFTEDERLLWVVTRLTDRYERSSPKPWAVSDAPPDYIAQMLKAVVGFRLEIANLEGKWKMSQNRTAQDRRGVADGLKATAQNDVAALVEKAAP